MGDIQGPAPTRSPPARPPLTVPRLISVAAQDRMAGGAGGGRAASGGRGWRAGGGRRPWSGQRAGGGWLRSTHKVALPLFHACTPAAAAATMARKIIARACMMAGYCAAVGCGMHECKTKIVCASGSGARPNSEVCVCPLVCQSRGGVRGGICPPNGAMHPSLTQPTRSRWPAEARHTTCWGRQQGAWGAAGAGRGARAARPPWPSPRQ
jgi:hypothetical protein